MTTKSIGTGYRLKDGKLIKKPPRMAAGQARGKSLKAARLQAKWKAKSK